MFSGSIRHEGTDQESGSSVKRMTDALYIASVSLYIVLAMLSDKTQIHAAIPSGLFSIVRYTCLALILVKICIAKDYLYYSKSGAIRLVAASILVLVVSYFSESRTTVHLLVIVVGSYKISFKKIAKYVLLCQTVTVIGVILLSVLGVIPSETTYRATTGSARLSLGFSYTTYPAILSYYLSGLYAYLRGERFNLLDFVTLLLINLIMYNLTATRTEIILVVTMLLGMLFIRLVNRAWVPKMLSVISIVMLPLLLIISLFASLNYSPSNPLLRSADVLLSERISLANRGILEYGVTPFGQDVEWVYLEDVGEEYSRDDFNIVDNCYINLLINYGVVFTVALFSGFMYVSYKSEDPYLNLMLIIMYIHMILTPQMTQIVYDVYLLCLAPFLLGEKSNIGALCLRNQG